MDGGSDKSPGKTSKDWVSHKGKKISSRVRKVTKTVASKLESGNEDQKKVEEYLPPSKEMIRQKEADLNEAMKLNEQLARAIRSKRETQKQIRALNHKLDTTNAWISGIKDNPKFIDVTAIGKLYEEIKSLKNYMKVVEAGGVVECDRVSVGSGGDTSLASLGDDFAATEVNCSVCREPRAALKAMWCHRCGYYVCETCIDAARQCPKCLEGNIDQYSVGGGESGGGDDDALSLKSLGFRATDSQRKTAQDGKIEEQNGGKEGGRGPSGSFRTSANEAGYLMLTSSPTLQNGINSTKYEEENIYETID